MNTPSKAKLTARSRAEMIHRIVDLHQPGAVVAAGFGLSERCAYKWLARFRAEGAAGLADRSSRPKSSPRTLHPLRVARVLALRRRKLPAFQIARAAKPSKASVSRRLCRHAGKLAALWPPPPICRYEREHPGDLIPFDIKKLARRGGGVRDKGRLENGRAIVRTGHRATGDRQRDHTRGAGWEFLHIAIDDHSRLACAALLPDETARSSILFLHPALAFCGKLGVKAQRSYSDNGSCSRAHAMREAVAALGLKQRFTRPSTPKTNGKAERCIQTSLREWAYAHSDQRSARLPLFLHNDNFHRPHHSLKLRSPISRLRLPMNNVFSLHS